MNTIEIKPNKANAAPYYYYIDGIKPFQKGYNTKKEAMKAAKAKVLRVATK